MLVSEILWVRVSLSLPSFFSIATNFLTALKSPLRFQSAQPAPNPMNQFKVGGVLLKIREGVFLKEVKRIAELEVEAAFGGDVGVISNEWLLRGNARVKNEPEKKQLRPSPRRVWRTLLS